ncbi:MAG: hypothetical protein V2I74_11780 [Erythrobacter sp.]|nr:hypothetical protein [Erythrobacter sp.]
MSLSALLLAAASPAQFGTSPLVDPPHEHEWKPFAEDEGGTVWWDKNVTGKVNIDGVEYPKIILRKLVNKDDWASEWYVYVDAAWAVDCSTNQMAHLDLAADGKRADPWVGHAPAISFRSISEMEMDTVQEMMRAVCGEGWTR